MKEPKHFSDHDLAIILSLFIGIVVGYALAAVMNGILGFK